MEMVDHLIPKTSFNEAELLEIKKAFSNPVVVKYLKNLADEDIKELITMGSLSRSDADVANAHRISEGKLAVLSTLISIHQE